MSTQYTLARIVTLLTRTTGCVQVDQTSPTLVRTRVAWESNESTDSHSEHRRSRISNKLARDVSAAGPWTPL